MWSVTVLMLLSVICVQAEPDKKICFPHLGCFDDLPPFNATAYLPESPEELDVKFKLFTPQDTTRAEYLSYTDVSSINGSHFDASLPVKVLIHGFQSSAKSTWVTEMKDEILKKEKVNVIDIDWSKGADTILYGQAVANIRLVAVQIKLLLELMADNLQLPLKNVHIIGHSLGAHMAGYVGSLLHAKVGRITALDAAELDFEGFPPAARVDSTDAMFVDAIHTDAGPFTSLGASGGLGLMQPIGHVDYYVNGGVKQPGCKTFWQNIWNLFGKRKRGLSSTFACNHVRSHEVFTASINNPCLFKSFPCESYDKFQRGECATCGVEGCGTMGYSGDSAAGRGKQYLKTLGGKPFCGYQYKIVAILKNVKGLGNLRGELHVNFAAKNGELTSRGVIKISDAKIDNSIFQGLVIVDKQFYPIDAIIAHFKLKQERADAPIVVMKIEVISLNTNKKQETKSGLYSVDGKISVTIPMEKPSGSSNVVFG